MNEPEHAILDTKLALLAQDISYIRISVDTLNQTIEKHYVRKDELDTLRQNLTDMRNIVFGLGGLIISTVIVAIVYSVLK